MTMMGPDWQFGALARTTRAALATLVVLVGVGALCPVLGAAPPPAGYLRVAPGEPLPDPGPGTTVHLTPGFYEGPWEITSEGVVVEAHGAMLIGPTEGSAVILAAPGITISGLIVNGAGPVDDLYTPDTAFWLIDCADCQLNEVTVVNARSAVRVESSPAASVTGGFFTGAAGSPALTVFDSPGLTLTQTRVEGYLDGVYIENSDSVSVVENEFSGASRYALHVMFSRDTQLLRNVVRGGNVGSAVMYGRDIVVSENLFEGHVGPLAFGLLLQELENAVVNGNRFDGNTVGMLIVSAPDVRIEANIISNGGFGMLVRRSRLGPGSDVTVVGNTFFGNVSDVAVDDPEAAVTTSGNSYEAASRLDMDGDGVSDVPFLPSSTYDMLASRQSDLSLFALSPGILLWQSAEATVPALRLATLTDEAPRISSLAGTRTSRNTGGAVLAVGLLVVTTALGTLVTRPRTALS